MHNNGSYIRKISDNKIKIYFTWCHKNPMEEVVITKNDVIESFKNKWDVIYEEINESKYEDVWQNYFNSFKTIVLKKICK